MGRKLRPSPSIMKLKKINQTPIFIGAGAVFHYSKEIEELCARESRFGDAFSMCRVFGPKDNQRIIVPRNMGEGGDDLRKPGIPFKFKSSFKPRNDEQARVIDETVQLLAQGRSFMLEAPTGSGKTWMSVDVIAQMGLKTLVVVTKEDIRDQWIAAFKALLGLEVGKGIGLIQGDTCSVTGQGVVIAMIQSLSKEDRYPSHIFNDFGLAIWDETHRVGADHFSQSCFRVPAKLRLGISATPDRKDGKEEVIHAHIGPVLVRSEVPPLTPRIIIRRSPWEIPYVRVKKKDGSYGMAQLPHSPGKCGHVIRMVANHHGRNQVIANFVSAAHAKGRNILVQSDRREHLEQLAAMISKKGVPVGDIAYYVGGMSSSQRDHAKKKRIILATYAMTAEATDIPWLDTLVMATPKSDVRQIVGRILRLHPDKKDPVVFDLVDATSSVFMSYANNRRRWYSAIGAEVDVLSN